MDIARIMFGIIRKNAENFFSIHKNSTASIISIFSVIFFKGNIAKDVTCLSQSHLLLSASSSN